MGRIEEFLCPSRIILPVEERGEYLCLSVTRHASRGLIIITPPRCEAHISCAHEGLTSYASDAYRREAPMGESQGPWQNLHKNLLADLGQGADGSPETSQPCLPRRIRCLTNPSNDRHESEVRSVLPFGRVTGPQRGVRIRSKDCRAGAAPLDSRVSWPVGADAHR